MIFKQLLIVFCLGFSSGLPMSLVSSTLQAWFAHAGVSIWVTSSLSLVSMPYLYRFLWSPLLDRYAILQIGRRRGWILSMQILLVIGFNVLTWFVPNTSPAIMAALALIIALFSATQDAAIDAHRTEYLPVHLYGIGASIATLGYRIAMLLSGGVALILAQSYGWVFTYRVMSAAMIIGMLAVFWSPEPKNQTPNTRLWSTFTAPVKELLSRPEIVPLCMFILLYKASEMFTTSISGIIMPFLIQGLGFSLATIGYVIKIWGVLAIIIGGLVSGWILARWTLYRALMLFGILQACTNMIFIALAAASTPQLYLLVLAVVSDNFAAGMGTTAIVALLMRFVNQKYTATQFSILVSFAGLPRVLSGPIGAFLHEHYGWVGLYCIATFLALTFIPFLHRLRWQPCFQVEKYTYDQPSA